MSEESVPAAFTAALERMSVAIETQSRVVSSHIETQTRTLEKVADKVSDINERLIRVESRQHDREIADLKRTLGEETKRIDDLEELRSRASGAAMLAGAVKSFGPWLVGAVAAICAWIAGGTAG